MEGIGFGLGFLGVVMVLSLGGFALWIWALVDVLRTPDERFQTANQLIWVLVVVLGNVIGAIIYLTIGRPRSGPAQPL